MEVLSDSEEQDDGDGGAEGQANGIDGVLGALNHPVRKRLRAFLASNDERFETNKVCSEVRQPVEILQNTFFQVERAGIAQLRPGSSFLLSAPRFS